METNWNQLIERYLNNELSAEGKAAFETELKQNKELQQEFELHKLTTEIIQRDSLRTLVKESGKWFHLKKILINSGFALVIAGVLATALYLAVNWKDMSTHSNKPEQIEQSMLEKLEKELAFENIDPEYFQFTGESDVFLSESGVLLSITNESFLLNGKPYTGEAIVQWQEAQKASDIVKAGLSTKSGDRLLETQGMFSLNAFTPDGQKLQLTKEGVYVQVPVDELKKDMKLFTGVPQKDGTIDWQRPEELERLPKPKDMSEMDLYPQNYEPKLNELKWFTEKAKRDSLYLSFEEHLSEEFDLAQEAVNLAFPSDTIKVEGINWWNKPIDSYPKDMSIRGKLLFQAKCATCHMASRDGTGPKLFGVRQKWADGGAKEGSIYQWVPNWNKAAYSDPYALMVSKMKQTAQNNFPELEGRTKEIDAIFNYIDGELYEDELVENNAAVESMLIPPSKVLAIWDPKFNGTNLATQDFEDRMKAIHGTCNKKVLEVYVSNLNTPLWELDQRVVKLGYPQFQSFADQKVGKVKLDDMHQKSLSAFYEKAIETLRETGKKNVEAAFKKEQQWDKEVMLERDREVLRQGVRASLNASAEANFNLVHLSKQLGQTLGFAITSETVASRDRLIPQNWTGAPAKQELPIVVNIDRLTKDLLSSRKSVDVFTLDKGKKAEIRYADFVVKVESPQKYDRLYFYLLPEQLNSYERLDFVNGTLNYALNSAIGYSGLIFGLNENGFYLFEIPKLSAKDFGSMKLEQVSAQQFESHLKELNKNRGVYSEQISAEIGWLFKEKANYTVQRKRRENLQFRNEVRPTIYSCLSKEKPVEDNQPTLKAVPMNKTEAFSQDPFAITDVSPSFPGGTIALRKFFNDNIIFPKAMYEKNIDGKVYIRFIVDENGNVSNVTVKKGISNCPECDQEAVRLVKKLPAFVPGKLNGKNVSSNYVVPVSFRSN